MFSIVQNWIYETLVQPLLFAGDLMSFSEIAFDGIEWFMVGVIEVIALAIILSIIEKRSPFAANVMEGLSPKEQKETRRLDIFYTLFHRLGVFPLIAFACLTPFIDGLEAQLRLIGWSGINIDQVLPGLTDIALVSLVIYLVLLDFADYWVHRAQHKFNWWWQLHAVHHSQRFMTFWSDQRNHLVDDLLRDAVLAGIAIFIGVAPEQFISLVVVSRVLQSIQHANWDIKQSALRMANGEMWCAIVNGFSRVFVGPRFHRVHHGIGIGHEGQTFGVNFGVLFSFWDVIFRTADFGSEPQPTGIRDQLTGRAYGSGFWSQQWFAVKRIFE